MPCASFPVRQIYFTESLMEHVLVIVLSIGAVALPAFAAYDPKRETFTLTKSLLVGLTYPHDWGFVPSTRAEDGDPLDVMVIHDAATFPGLMLACRIIGILQIRQKSRPRSSVSTAA